MTASDAGAAGPGGSPNMIKLLEAALAPVEPPARLGEALEERLANLQAVALEELSDWELAAMRDPRNWVRPAAAVAIGTAAGRAAGPSHAATPALRPARARGPGSARRPGRDRGRTAR